MTLNRTSVFYAKDGDEPYWPLVISLKQSDEDGQVCEHCFFFHKNQYALIAGNIIKAWLTKEERDLLKCIPDALWLAEEWLRYYSEVSMSKRYRPNAGDLVLVTEDCFTPWPAKVAADPEMNMEAKLLDDSTDDVEHFLCKYVGQAASSYIKLAMIRPFNAHNAHKALTLIAPRTKDAKRDRDEQHAAIELALAQFLKQ